MNVIAQDPKGYYSTLGLSPGADLAAVKSAYRSRVKAVHPDRNGSEPAREEFRRLVEAYTVLKDVLRKAEYDTGAAALDSDDDTDAPAAPYCCTACGKVTAQPRFVAMHTVTSYLVWAKTARVEGIFCRDCADRAAVRASTRTWLQGWWSPPGLLLTPIALLRNLFGGSIPKRQNARLLIRQARAFLAMGQPEIARSLAGQAADFACNARQRQAVEDLHRATADVADGNRRLRNRWRPGGGVFAAQLLPLLALPVVVAVFGMIATRPWQQPVQTRAGGIAMRPATVGEIRHVAVEDLKVRAAPVEGAPVLSLLDRFATVEVIADTETPEWVKVRTPAGLEGFVAARSLYAGSGSRFKREWCTENRGTLPSAGEVLTRRVSGDNRLLVHNDGRRDGVVKLKTLGGNTVMAFYVPATYHVGVVGIPEGTYRIEFATGTNYSRGCGVFLDNMQASMLPVTLTFRYVSPTTARTLAAMAEISLVPPANDPRQPQPLDPDRFAADD
ncbi:MAG: DnaJ domain-containing protein [Actinomycetota bacterium]